MLVAEDANKLLDELLRILDLKKDAELCERIKIDPANLSRLRRRRLQVGPALLIRMHKASGLPVSDLKKLIEQGHPKKLPADKRTTRPKKPAQEKSTTSGTRIRYPIAFKLEAASLVVNGMPISDAATKKGVPPQTLHNWVKAWQTGKLALPCSLDLAEYKYLAHYCLSKLSELKSRKSGNAANNEEFKILKNLDKKLQFSRTKSAV